MSTKIPANRRQGPGALTPSSRAVLSLLMILFSLYCLLPIWWLVVSSTKNGSQLYSSSGFWFPSHLNLVDNVRRLIDFQSGVFGRWALNTVLYAVVGAFLATLFAAAAGFVFAKFRFPLRGGFFALILGGVLLPPNVLAIPLYLLFSRVHATNTVWAVFLPSLVSPFGVYLCRIISEAGVPDELLEAARIDGAGEFRIFFAIVLRLIRPALVTVFLFQFVAIWNNVLLPLVMLSNQRLFPVTLGLYSMYAGSSSIGAPADVIGMVVTGVLISVIPLIIAFLALQKYWRGGVAIGAIRG